MCALSVVTEPSKVVQFNQYKVIDGGLVNKKYNKDGSIKRTHSNKIAGKSSEVYAFRTNEEIKAMMSVFDKHIVYAPDDEKEKIAYRNKLMFSIGINVGIRASDLRTLKWSFFYNEDGSFKRMYVIFPKKTKDKPVKLFFNDTVKSAIEKYVSKYPVEDLDSYLFPSRKGNGPICESSICRIIKEAAAEAGVKQNIGSHSMRKTWGYWCWHEAEDKNYTLTMLMKCFNHSNTAVTMKYIGITDDEIEEVYNSINLGFGYI